METRVSLSLAILGVLIVSSLSFVVSQIDNNSSIPIARLYSSSFFPKGFYFGSATSSYQTEGEARSKGRGPSIWDTFAHLFPERIADRSNGDVATDFYNRYGEDIKKMMLMGLNAFRFSISWSRIIPSGKVEEGINEEGIKFYNKVIDDAIAKGLEPFVTLFHWDLPQALEDKYGGFLSREVVTDYQNYAELCFLKFGDRVKHWITLNEPYIFTVHGYDTGIMAPGRCSYWVNKACLAGDSATEPYKVGHNLLLAHAAAVHVYRKMNLDGKIGITLDVSFPLPRTDSVSDREAAQRELDFAYGWFMDPIVYGQYPRIMRQLVPVDRLPEFTTEESRALKGSIDFVGLNYYYSNLASPNTTDPNYPNEIRYLTDSQVNLTRYGIYPEGLRYLLNYTKDTYKNPEIYITETGLSDDKSLTNEEALKDKWRIQYFSTHLQSVLRAICDYNVDVKGFFAWSFMDNYEWSNGYTLRYGFYQIERKENLKRKAKLSVSWMKKFLQDKDKADVKPRCIIPLVGEQPEEEEDMAEL